MSTLKVIIEKAANNYAAYIDGVDGIAVTGKSIADIKQKMQEAVSFFIEVAIEDGSYIPEPLQGEYRFEFIMDVQTLLIYYDGVIGKPALEKLTGINQKQLWHYEMGKSKPRPERMEKIQNALHRLGEEFLSVQLVASNS